MITIFDVMDFTLVMGCFAVASIWRVPSAYWAAGGLLLYHVGGRWIVFQMTDPLPLLALGQWGVALGYLLSPVLSNYGRVVGTLFVLMSFSTLAAVAAGMQVTHFGGMQLDLWNFQSACLTLAAITIMAGTIRRGALIHHHRSRAP